jgi:hypothetical protein
MSKVELRKTDLPEFGVPAECPGLAKDIYRQRLDRLRDRMRQDGFSAFVVYADREHFANMAYLTGVDPRFEESLLVVREGRDPVVITGPENQGPARKSAIDVEVILYPPFGLLGQDRSATRPLDEILGEAGIHPGDKVGVAGWKYFTPVEMPRPELTLEIPSFVAEALRDIAGTENVLNATAVLMHCRGGMRAENEVDQLAQFEFATSHSSQAIRRMLFGLKAGMTEFEAAALMATIQYPLNCHPMLSSGERAYLGLGSPSGRRLEVGDQITCALGLWGSLTCRAGWMARTADDLPDGAKDYVEKLAGPFYLTALDWYENIGIGVSGGAIDALVRRRLGDPFFNLVLNPGHLIHYDEWLDTPVYPNSDIPFRSHQAVQLDIIPATGTAYFTANMEEGIALLDAEGRREFADRHPEAWSRIQHRREFMQDVMGIRLRPEVLPFSNLCGYLAPFFLAPDMALMRC